MWADTCGDGTEATEATEVASGCAWGACCAPAAVACKLDPKLCAELSTLTVFFGSRAESSKEILSGGVPAETACSTRTESAEVAAVRTCSAESRLHLASTSDSTFHLRSSVLSISGTGPAACKA